ncbi:isopentenyl-diphosphate Delta-isomerase [Rhodococcus sp. BGS-1C]|uniref:isopentenyl-diphosphate Delta-isomerase n=1 Tax=unclassified Rhodococcus (in: high G+C Gram-positive bacteria) TaxID=192944 RepID=UPI0009613D5F|nr:isopentenyl-diphosphate Delta-isomerase [Rhodococcus sp. KRD197]OLT33518.1 isopentenyl-diphosphate delta-isomerase [Rhodococcus sp. CUA-806]
MPTTRTRVPEEVVLVDDDGHAVGTQPKSTVHTTDTPLHLAFSCYVFNSNNEVLITRRAGHKKTWPDVTTNSCCGHPAPGEDLGGAVIRRLGQELGIVVADPWLLLPDFRYRAVMADGTVENELCPVYGVRYDGPDPQPDPEEVSRAEWIPWAEFSRFVDEGGAVSPWCAEQMPRLRALGDDPARWPTGSASDLPPAARHP